MQFTLLCPGTPRHTAAAAWSADYAARIAKLAPFERRAVRAARRTTTGLDRAALERESAALLQAIPGGGHVVLLDPAGKRLDCDSLRDEVQKLADSGVRAIWLVIGGPDGVDERVRGRAQALWSLSPLTLPHELAEVVLLEQIYRALTRIKGLPYHR